MLINKRGQLKIQEMAFMLVAVFLFFILVGLFVMAIVFSNVNEDAKRIAEERTLSSLTNLADSPEFSCVGSIDSKPNCIDGDKLISILDKEAYEEFWPYSSLRVLKYSGFGKSDDELVTCTITNYPECDMFEVYDKEVENERAISSFIAFCRLDNKDGYINDKCEVAKLIAGTKLDRGS